MNKTRIYWIIIVSILFCTTESLFAEVNADINGNINTDTRVRLDPQEMTRNETRITLKLEGAPYDTYHYYGEAQLKGTRDLNAADQYQWDLDLREGYLDLYQFFSDYVDVRIGKQIFAWGRADRLNPTSNVSPVATTIWATASSAGISPTKVPSYSGRLMANSNIMPKNISAARSGLGKSRTMPRAICSRR